MANEQDIQNKKTALHDIAARRKRSKVVYEGDLGHYVTGDTTDSQTWATRSRDWAISGSIVDNDNYSARQWATKLGEPVDGELFSAAQYAVNAQQSELMSLEWADTAHDWANGGLPSSITQPLEDDTYSALYWAFQSKINRDSARTFSNISKDYANDSKAFSITAQCLAIGYPYEPESHSAKYWALLAKHWAEKAKLWAEKIDNFTDSTKSHKLD